MKTCVHLWPYRAEFFLERETFQTKDLGKLNNTFFYFFIFINPLYVTICPEPFSNFCVDSVRGMLEILPMKFQLLFSIARIGWYCLWWMLLS